MDRLADWTPASASNSAGTRICISLNSLPRVAQPRGIGRKQHDAVPVKPRIQIVHIDQRAPKQSGSDEQ